MFTGLIRDIGDVVSDSNHILTIKSTLKPKIGDSIAVNGVCLTVVAINSNSFCVEAADETRSIVPPQKLKGRVHLEPAMRMGDRFEGHIVQGHIDTTGEVVSIHKGDNATEFTIEVDAKYIPYIVPKGSIAIDGVSLTVNRVFNNAFTLAIIPHTLQNTLIRDYKINSIINIETDMFARYIEHILTYRNLTPHKAPSWEEIDAISLSF